MRVRSHDPDHRGSAQQAADVGWSSGRLGAAAMRATAGLVLADVANDVSDAALGLNDSLSVTEIMLWSAIAVVIGPVIAVLAAAGRPRRWSALPGLSAPMVMAYFGVSQPSGNAQIQPWSQWAVIGAAAIMALAPTVRVSLVPHGDSSRPAADA